MPGLTKGGKKSGPNKTCGAAKENLHVTKTALFAAAPAFIALVMVASSTAAAEMSAHAEESQAPDTGKADDGVNDSGHGIGVAMTKPGDEIKLEKSPESPVQGSSDDQ
jgi:uncharacterized membrane protein